MHCIIFLQESQYRNCIILCPCYYLPGGGGGEGGRGGGEEGRRGGGEEGRGGGGEGGRGGEEEGGRG